jgi:hypothetical protein
MRSTIPRLLQYYDSTVPPLYRSHVENIPRGACATAPPTPRHLLPYFPFDTVNICANLAPLSRNSLQSSISHAEHPVSEYVVSCEKRVLSLPMSFDISEFKSFES